MESSESFIIVDSKEGAIRLEYTKYVAILHISRMSDLTPSVYRWGYNQFLRICSFLNTIGYDKVHIAAPEDDPKVNKIAVRLGFTVVGNQDNYNIYVKELN